MPPLLTQIHKTFYCPRFYRSLLFDGKGLGFVFLFCATLINMAAFFYLTATPINIFLKEQKIILEHLPEATIKNGFLSIEKGIYKTTLFADNPDLPPLQVHIDTTTEPMDDVTLALKMKKEDITIYVDKEKLSLYDPDFGSLRKESFSSAKDQTITHDIWVRISDAISKLFLPILVIGFFIADFFNQLAACFAGGFVLFVLGRLLSINPDLKGALRVAAAAKIPSAILAAFLATNLGFNFLVWFAFAIFGLLAGKAPRPQTES